MSVPAQVVLWPQAMAARHESELAPGTNAAGDLAASDWRFLLPRLQYRRILHLGLPRAPVLRVLAEMADHAVIVSADAIGLSALRAQCSPPQVELLRADASGPLPCAPAGFDLVLSSGGPDTAALLRSPDWVAELGRLLSAEGVALLETDSLAGAARLRQEQSYRRHGFREPQLLWLARRKGALRLAVPLGKETSRRYCLDQVVAGVSRRGRLLRQAARSLTRMGVLDFVVARRVVLLERAQSGMERTTAAPYVLSQVRAAGVPLRDPHVALFARGDHNSNKVTFLVFDGAEPSVVVKLPRAPRYNPRLEHEHNTLTALSGRGAASPGSYPEALFLQYHHGLAMAGQVALQGAIFRNVSEGTARCSVARATIEWITQLGEASTGPRPAGTPPVAAQLASLVDRFNAVYPVTEQERFFLHAQVAVFGQRGSSVPAVFQHGDAGTWNVLVRPDQRVALLDWEDGDTCGMPLWDLFVFLQSFSAWAGRLHGVRDHATAAAAALFEPTRFNELLVAATRQYCGRLGIPRDMVEPLFYTCWVDRALRTVPWVQGALGSSMFFRLLRLAIAGREKRALACLFE